MHRPLRPAVVLLALTAAAALAGCGGGDDATAAAEVPEGATLCGVYAEDYQPILTNPTAFGEEGFEEEAQELVTLAQQLEALAPADVAEDAADNTGYFRALANTESASDFVSGSNAFNQYLAEEC